jgi:hypothetical protein
MTEQDNSPAQDGAATRVKRPWSAPVLTQLGLPSTQGGFVMNFNETIFIFDNVGDMNCEMGIFCPS